VAIVISFERNIILEKTLVDSRVGNQDTLLWLGLPTFALSLFRYLLNTGIAYQDLATFVFFICTISPKGIVQFWSCKKVVANVFDRKVEPSSATNRTIPFGPLVLRDIKEIKNKSPMEIRMMF